MAFRADNGHGGELWVRFFPVHYTTTSDQYFVRLHQGYEEEVGAHGLTMRRASPEAFEQADYEYERSASLPVTLIVRQFPSASGEYIVMCGALSAVPTVLRDACDVFLGGFTLAPTSGG